MTKIQIIKGVYGHKENGSPVPKDKNSEPFEISDAKAKELIEAGIAVVANSLKSEAEKTIKYSQSLAPQNNLVNKKEQTEAETQKDDSEVETNQPTNEDDNKLVYSMQNTKKDLLAMAINLGFEGDETVTKQQLIDFLDEVTASDEPNIGDNEGVVE